MKPVILAVAAALLIGSVVATSPERARAVAEPSVPEEPAQRIALADPKSPVKSLLNVARPMRYGQFLWDEAGVPAGPVTVQVDRDRQLISVFRGGHEIGTAVILYGADGTETPAGAFPILAKSERHRSNAYEADMPYSLWLTRDGIAIHASDVREGRATHGCIAVPLAFAQKLFESVRTGDVVTVA